ncbi:probable protein ABIL5 isoform X2 [Typha latifolia]|uniref:probable protein ABIL5 isoform X2 n=1 Tax=Typha latifolia TaxID=4733 RepID=UPI003C2B4C3D
MTNISCHLSLTPRLFSFFLCHSSPLSSSSSSSSSMEVEIKEEQEKRFNPITTSFMNSDAKTDAEGFIIALRELKDLRSQLYKAADCSKDAFLKAEKKKMILQSTKSYISDAIVTVIDHLGNVSSKLEHQLNDDSELMQTEQKIDCLKQRLLTCQQFAVLLELSTVRWKAKLPRHHLHYLSQSQRTKEQNCISRDEDSKVFEPQYKNDQLIILADSPTSVSAKSHAGNRICGKELAMVLSDRYTPSTLMKSFGLKVEDARIVGRDDKKKSTQASNFLSFLRMNRRKA